MHSGILKSRLIWLTVFGVAVGYLESAVVIYLRELYYPSGFAFPLSAMTNRIALTELLRELSTLVILLSIAFLAGNNRKQRVAVFFYVFAIWDIFYYVFLKLLLNWPASFFTWDILFLIPTTWTGPVITPLLVSLTMIVLAVLLLRIDNQFPLLRIPWRITFLLLLGAGILFISFIWDYSCFMIRHLPVSGWFSVTKVQDMVRHYMPDHFNWWLFSSGLLLVYLGLWSVFALAKNKPSS